MENSVELAKYMQKYVCEATGRQNMGAQQDNLAVLRLSSMPGCLIELGFISTRDEEQYMNSKAAEGQYARGVFNAFLAYRKRHGGNITIPYISASEPQPRSKSKREVVPEVVAQEPVVPMDTVVKEPEAVAEELVVAPVVQPVASPAEPVAQPIKEPVADPVAKPKEEPVAVKPVEEAPVFKVQILVSSSRLRSTDARFKGLSGVASYQEGGMFKYTVGCSEDYHEIYQLRKSIVDKFPQAFIVAFRNGVRMDVNEARKIKVKK